MSDAAEPVPPPEEPKMEIHKPKPIHSWRELLTEIGVIVIGVAIALAAEQGVEWLHWQGEVTVARREIQAEMAFNNIFYARRFAVSPCLEKQAVEAGRILDDLEAGRPPTRFTVFQEGMGTSLRENEWQSERSAQSLTHFPRAELALMSNHYTQVGFVRDWVQHESEAWMALSVLRHPPKEMPVSDRLRLRTALEVVINAEGLIAFNAERQLRLGHQLGIATPPADPKLVEKFCTANYEEYRSYVRSLEPRN